MKDIVFERHEEMLFALLRSSLHERLTDTTFFCGCTEKDWQSCRALASRQGVMALAWDGVMKLPDSMKPPISVKLAWASAVEAYEKKYRYYCRTVYELSRFYAGHGISVMQLKGVGLSAIYPVPAHREGGDIDIYTYSADKDRMTDAEANRLADELMTRMNIEVDVDRTPKHSMFYYKRVPVENHKTFLNVETYESAVEAERVLKENMNPQPTVLADGEVLTPSPMFNKLFVAFHAAQHTAGGLALHHLCDWACLLNHCGMRMPDGLTDRRFLRYVDALTLLCNKLLDTGIPVKNPPEKLAAKLLGQILYPPFSGPVNATTKAGVIIYKTRRMIHAALLTREVFGKSVTKTVLSSAIEHIRRPDTIFRV